MIERRAGVRIDADRFDYELARRGINPRQFAELSGLMKPLCHAPATDTESESQPSVALWPPC